ncbi:MAG TPA: glycosyltransferase [Polyangiales bacterium]|nr:glycosyltransferase [Polyangiales bacterium]
MNAALLRWTSYQLWKAQCRLNLPLIGLVQGDQRHALEQAWELDSSKLGTLRPGLCVVITTHKRPEACAALLTQLHAELPVQLRSDTQVIVLEDASSSDYTSVFELGQRLFDQRFLFLRSRRWLGKQGYYLTYQAAFTLARRIQPTHTLFIQDDLSLAPDFFARAFALWGSIRDRKKAVLSLISFGDDEVHGRWTRYKRRKLLGGKVWKTQWFDLPAYLVDEYFFETLGYRVFPADPLRFARGLGISSGIGEQLTRRLWRRGNIYQAAQTLVFHGEHESVMNTNARGDRPFDNRAVVKQARSK